MVKFWQKVNVTAKNSVKNNYFWNKTYPASSYNVEKKGTKGYTKLTSQHRNYRPDTISLIKYKHKRNLAKNCSNKPDLTSIHTKFKQTYTPSPSKCICKKHL